MKQDRLKQAKTEPTTGKYGALLIAAMFIIAGIVVLYDTASYSDTDSKVFPQAAAILLIICSTISLLSDIIKGTHSDGFGDGSWWRRGVFVGGMLLAPIAMPFLGFLGACSIAFIAGLVAAMHERWSTKTAIIYWSTGALVMLGFYALFRYVLQVPLP